jgi:hypothetical protein
MLRPVIVVCVVIRAMVGILAKYRRFANVFLAAASN